MPVRLTPLPPNAAEEKNPQILMSVATPASEYNSTERVNAVTYKVISEEIRRANEILQFRKDFSEVCRKIDFFSAFPIFVEIDINGHNASRDD